MNRGLPPQGHCMPSLPCWPAARLQLEHRLTNSGSCANARCVTDIVLVLAGESPYLYWLDKKKQEEPKETNASYSSKSARNIYTTSHSQSWQSLACGHPTSGKSVENCYRRWHHFYGRSCILFSIHCSISLQITCHTFWVHKTESQTWLSLRKTCCPVTLVTSAQETIVAKLQQRLNT